VLLYVPDSSITLTYLAMLLFCIVAVSTGSLAIYAPAFYILSVLAVTPFVVRTFIGGSAFEFALGIPIAIGTLAALSFGRRVNQLVHESIRRRFENMDLIAELKRQKLIADTARLQAEAANRSKTQFFAAASHDLRQPLHALGLFTAALSEKVLDSGVLNVIKNINTSVNALEGLFHELLDISKIDAGVIRAEITDFPIDRVLDRLRPEFEPEAFEKGLRLRVRKSGAAVHSDPILVERVLRNLLANAIRYTSEGGIVLGCRTRNDKLRVEVWDTGLGITRDQRERIFEEFYQIGNPERSGRKGLGLGLAIVRRLVHLLGTDIRLVSQPGRGTVFRFDLPRGRATKTERGADQRGAHAPTNLRGRLIVVIDDENTIVEGMRVLLAGWGADVICSTTGIDILERVHEAGRLPDLIIADYRLAETETGTQVIERLRNELDPEIPAILITGSATPERVEEAKSHGYHLLVKPVLPAKLRTLINFKLRGTAAA
jgi:signal transduction histidine kinase